MPKQLGFKKRRSLSMVTMNGEECHNEWKSHMKKFTETVQLLLLFLTIIALPVITYIPEKDSEVLIVLHASGIKELF
jgi:hypothetical protein